MAQPHGFYNNPPAYMGFVGFVKLRAGNVRSDQGAQFSHGDMIVRATDADVAASQEITKPDIIDSRYDKTVYQLGPLIVEGSLGFPAVYDMGSGQNIVETLYRYVVTRDPQGLLSDFDVDIKYATGNSAPNESEFTYDGCIANTFQFSVSAEDVVNITTDIIGINRRYNTIQSLGEEYMQNTRVVTWNDARVEISGGALDTAIGGQFVREFEANVNNNAERFYTLNTHLMPQAIAPTKRDVDGSLTLMGRHMSLGELAWTNQNRCDANVDIKFGFETKVTAPGCDAAFGTTIPNCVFEIEEMALTLDLFETTVNWHALPAAGTGITDPLITSIGDTEFTYPVD